jgi:hypothetical protein
MLRGRASGGEITAHWSEEETIRETNSAMSLAWCCEAHSMRVLLWRCERLVGEYERAGMARVRLRLVTLHDLIVVMLPL